MACLLGIYVLKFNPHSLTILLTIHRIWIPLESSEGSTLTLESYSPEAWYKETWYDDGNCQALSPNPPSTTTTHHPSMKEGSHKKNSKSKNVLEWSPLLVHQKKNSAGQWKEEHQVVHHVQGEHHKSYLLHKHLGYANSVQEGPNAVVFCALTAIPKYET